MFQCTKCGKEQDTLMIVRVDKEQVLLCQLCYNQFIKDNSKEAVRGFLRDVLDIYPL